MSNLKGDNSVTLPKNKTASYSSDSPVETCNVTLTEGRGTVTFTLRKNGQTKTRTVKLSRESGQQSGDGDSEVTKVVVKGKGNGDNNFTVSASV
jgi:hypothetical protein